jgi:hypothetical protein
MGKSIGRLYHDEVRARMPENVKRTTDKVLSRGAKATKKLRNREEIQRRGKAWTHDTAKGIRKAVGL